MEKVQALLVKIKDLNEQQPKSIIDIDLMLDNTRSLYTLLLEQRNELNAAQVAIVETEIDSPSSGAYIAPVIELNTVADELPSAKEEEDKPIEDEQPIFVNDAKTSVKDIRKTIGINDKYQILSELFSNNKETYEQVLGELNNFHNYPEAHTWLRAHLANNPIWDEESYTVQLLYGLMQRFFAEHRSF